jgi:hypothetical protein
MPENSSFFFAFLSLKKSEGTSGSTDVQKSYYVMKIDGKM